MSSREVNPRQCIFKFFSQPLLSFWKPSTKPLEFKKKTFNSTGRGHWGFRVLFHCINKTRQLQPKTLEVKTTFALRTEHTLKRSNNEKWSETPEATLCSTVFPFWTAKSLVQSHQHWIVPLIGPSKLLSHQQFFDLAIINEASKQPPHHSPVQIWLFLSSAWCIRLKSPAKSHGPGHKALTSLSSWRNNSFSLSSCVP